MYFVPSSLPGALQQMEAMLDDMNELMGRGRGLADLGGAPPINMWASEDALMVTAEMPGLDQESIGISVVGDTLTIKGKRSLEPIAEQSDVHRRERPEFEFTRSIQLPFQVDAEQAEARYKKGILSIALRRPEAEKPKKITVKAA
jgi:HSP20 family protein